MQRLLSGLVFCLFVFCSSPAWALTSGTSTSGYLDPGAEDTHTFSGTAGQGIVLTSPGVSTLWIEVYDPDMVYTGRTQNRRFQILSKTGTYTVKVYYTSSSTEGAYTLYYVGGGDSVSNGSLSSGSTETETLAPIPPIEAIGVVAVGERGAAGASCPVLSGGVPAPRPVAKTITVSPGATGFSAVTKEKSEAFTTAKIPGEAWLMSRLWAGLTPHTVVTLTSASPAFNPTGVWTLS